MPVSGNPKLAALVNRVKNILLQPAAEWEKIDAEPTTIVNLFKDYVAILAAIPAVCGFIGVTVFGVHFWGVSVRLTFFSALYHLVSGYIMSFIGIAVLGLVIDFLAPTFGGQKNQIQAFKVAAYSMTAAWVAGVLSLVPPLWIISVLISLYSLYLLYCGLPRLMKTPPDRALAYTAVVTGACIAVSILMHSLMTPHVAGYGMEGGSEISGELQLPGGMKMDIGTLMGSSGQPAAVEPVSPDALTALLPDGLPGGFTRSEISSYSGGKLNMPFAQGTYQRGQARITLRITDMAGIPGLARAAKALNGESSQETATSYAKTSKIDGRMTTEGLDRTSNHGSYVVTVADRFTAKADGWGITMDDLKAPVVALIDPLEKLAR